MYDRDWEYAASRLDGTIVRYRGRPVKVVSVRHEMKTVVEFIDTGRLAETTVEKLDLKPVPLGYVRYDNGSIYLVRRPVRRDWRQGLRHSTMMVMGENRPMNPANIDHADLDRCIRGDYPNIHEARGELKLGRYKVAWCREWAICREGGLWHKGIPVGSCQGDTLQVADEYIFLKESLQEACNEDR